MLKNILSSWSAIILAAVVVFITYPLLIERLGVEQYGVWLLIVSFTGYFSLLQMGIPAANVKYISSYLAKDDIENANRVLSTNLFFFNSLAILIILFGVIISKHVTGILGIPEELRHIATFALLISFFEIATNFAFESFEGLIHAKKEFFKLSLINNLGTITRLILFYLLIKGTNGIVMVALATYITTFLQSILLYLLARNVEPRLAFRFSDVNKQTFQKICSFSILVVLLQAADRITLSTNPLIIGHIISTSAVVGFSAANSILLYLGQLIIGVSRTMMPYFCEKEAQGEDQEMINIFHITSRYISFGLAFVCTMLIIFGRSFLTLWLGEEVAMPCYNILVILCCGQYLFLIQRGAAYPVFMGYANLKPIAFLSIGSAVLGAVINIIFALLFGIIGVAMGSALASATTGIVLFFLMCRYYHIDIKKYLIQVIIQPLLSILPISALAAILLEHVPIQNYKVLITTVILFSITHCGVGCLFLNKKERTTLLNKLKYKRKK